MTLKLPSGNVKTFRPGSKNPYNIPWTNVSRYEPAFTNAERESPIGIKLGIAMAILESDCNQTVNGKVIERWDNYPQDGPSVGIMQVKPKLWQSVLPSADAYTATGNIRLGFALMRAFIKQHGTWQKAIVNAYFPDNDPNGTTQNMYVQTITALMQEMGATETPLATKTLDDIYAVLVRIADKIGAAPAPTPTNPNPFNTPVIYNLAQHYGLFGLTQAQANKIINNRFENRNGGDPRFIVNHIQDGTTKGSLNWWATGAGVQASSTVMANKDGSILQIVPEQHGPWTNGDVNNPTEKSAALRALGGNPNNWSLTLEAEGTPGISSVSYTPEQLNAICWQFAEWMLEYKIPLKNVLSHASINFRDRANCPGNANMLKVLDEMSKAGFK